MKTVRKGVFETNSSSTHSVTLTRKTANPYYELTPSGYLMVHFYQLWSECDYSEYKTLNDKLSFLLTIYCDIYSEVKQRNYRREHKNYNWGETDITYSEFNKNEEIQNILKLVVNKVPNCKGVRFRKGSFNSESRATAECDGHHIDNIWSLQGYLKEYAVTLEDYLFNPNYMVKMNPGYCDTEL